MSLTSLATASPYAQLDWPSISWTLLLGGLTIACLAVEERFDRIAAAGRVPALMAHAVIGYFSLGMLAFGGYAAANAYFPVPGGSAWEGPIAVAGGFSAMTIGACTVVKHVAHVRESRRAAAAMAGQR